MTRVEIMEEIVGAAEEIEVEMRWLINTGMPNLHKLLQELDECENDKN